MTRIFERLYYNTERRTYIIAYVLNIFINFNKLF